MPQEFNSRDDAVLTERKSSHPMIAGRTQPARALIALNHRRILSMVGTVHHFKNSNLLTDCYDRCRPASCWTTPSADPVSVPAARVVSVPRRRELAWGIQ